jgi:hypothetical protein
MAVKGSMGWAAVPTSAGRGGRDPQEARHQLGAVAMSRSHLFPDARDASSLFHGQAELADPVAADTGPISAPGQFSSEACASSVILGRDGDITSQAAGRWARRHHDDSMQAFTSASWVAAGHMTSPTIDISTNWITTYGATKTRAYPARRY